MLKQSDFVKIVIAVPTDSADQVREALGKAGAGQQGNYDYCSGTYKKTGRFRPLPGSSPAIGEEGKIEEVEEEMIETICHKDILPAVIEAVKAAHPYEEPAIDIFPRLEIE